MQEFKLNKVFNWQTASDKINKTAYYSHSLDDGNVITVNTLKGIIEIDAIENIGGADPAFDGFVQIYINNPSLILTEANKDNIYVQLTPYYKPVPITDRAIPYIISNGVLVPNGVGISIYNASPAGAGADQWQGAFYLYYEIYTI